MQIRILIWAAGGVGIILVPPPPQYAFKIVPTPKQIVSQMTKPIVNILIIYHNKILGETSTNLNQHYVIGYLFVLIRPLQQC